MRLAICHLSYTAAAIVLSGCVTTGVQVPERVLVPTSVPCVTERPERPQTTPDPALFALDDYRLVLTLARERTLFRDYSALLEAALSGCL